MKILKIQTQMLLRTTSLRIASAYKRNDNNYGALEETTQQCYFFDRIHAFRKIFHFGAHFAFVQITTKRHQNDV
jgi:hypothetical protein